MTGLSSAAGTSLQARVRAAFDAAGRGNFGALSPRVVNAARIAATLLRSAVERSEMQASHGEPRQTEVPANPTGPPGQSLDVVA
jgi:hypothetical protein